VRLLDAGNLPLNEKLLRFHRDMIRKRAEAENRGVSFQMVIDDIYAISKGRLVGRPH
jgi:methylaspartate mutase epsilon subunit